MNLPNFLYGIKGITPEELQFLTQLLNGMTDEQVQRFVMIYSGKRFSTDTILLFTLLGFFIIAGVQRFATRQIGMGILYLFTGGLCFIGTIVDLINYRSIANEFNQTIAVECVQMVKMSYNGY